MEPPAAFAHIDQDPYQGGGCAPWHRRHASLLGGSTIDPAEAIESDLAANYDRTIIINLWRPVGGTVWDKPLAIADFRSLKQADISSGRVRTMRLRRARGRAAEVALRAPADQRRGARVQVLRFGPGQGEALYGAHCAVNRVKGGGAVPEGRAAEEERRVPVCGRLAIGPAPFIDPFSASQSHGLISEKANSPKCVVERSST